MQGPLEDLKYVEDLVESEDDEWYAFRWLGKYYLGFSHEGGYSSPVSLIQITEDQYIEYRDKIKKENKILTEEKKEENTKHNKWVMRLAWSIIIFFVLGLFSLCWFGKLEIESMLESKYTFITKKGNTQHVLVTKFRKDKLYVNKEAYDAAIIDSWKCEVKYNRNVFGYVFEGADSSMSIKKY